MIKNRHESDGENDDYLFLSVFCLEALIEEMSILRIVSHNLIILTENSTDKFLNLDSAISYQLSV